MSKNVPEEVLKYTKDGYYSYEDSSNNNQEDSSSAQDSGAGNECTQTFNGDEWVSFSSL